MSRILMTGASSRICQELLELLPADCEAISINRSECDIGDLKHLDSYRETIAKCDRIVLAHGEISGDPFFHRSQSSLEHSLAVNMLSTIRICEWALSSNPKVRIAIVGSESADKGSYDFAYWMAKAGVHAYVRQRRLQSPDQQLACVAPSMIRDAGMTLAKTAAEQAAAIAANPKGRAVNSVEIAKAIHFLLFVDQGYITNTVIEVNGGKFARFERGTNPGW